jgi:hypothetical protein
MKQRQRVLLVLICFPVVFFGLVLYMGSQLRQPGAVSAADMTIKVTTKSAVSDTSLERTAGALSAGTEPSFVYRIVLLWCR